MYVFLVKNKESVGLVQIKKKMSNTAIIWKWNESLLEIMNSQALSS